MTLMDNQKIEVLHISDCLDGGVPAVIDTLLSRPHSQALFLGQLLAPMQNAQHCRSITQYRRTFSPLGMLRYVWRLRAEIIRLNPKVVHLHSSYAGLLGALAAVCARVRFIYTPHASAMMIPEPGTKLRLVRQLERVTVALSSCVIACSKDEAGYFAWKRKGVVVISNGIPAALGEQLAARLAQPAVGKIDLIGIGRDSAQKDLDQFSGIADAVRQQRPGARIAWVGASARPGLSDGVDWMGYVSEQEVNLLLMESQVFLATSLYEGHSVAAIKAAMAGCDIVLRDKPGTRALAREGMPSSVYAEAHEGAALVLGLLERGHDGRAAAAQVALARRLYSQERQLRRTGRLYRMFL